jgi:hypothetical protein
MLSIKRGKLGAKMRGIQPEMFWAHAVVDQVYKKFGINECVLTEGVKGIHKSIVHYLGFAIDIRTKNIRPSWSLTRRIALITQIKVEIQKRLGEEYEVIFEPNKRHFHIEFDPRKAERLWHPQQ